MFIRNQPILHAVFRQTHFSRAAPLSAQDSFTIWETFMRIWVLPYLGVPYNLWIDQAKSFLSVQFKTLASSLGCNLVPIAVEAHWSLIAERYHDPLRRISNKLIVEHPAAPLPLLLDYANLAMSHTIGPEGFTPAILAFGAQPRLPIGNYDQIPQSVTNRMDLMTSARREYEAVVAQFRIRRAINSASPNEQVTDLTPGDEVLVYREKKRWDGPYTFLYRDGRLSVVLDNKGCEHFFHSTMLKAYHRPNTAIKDLLNPADAGFLETVNSYLVEMVRDEHDPRFSASRQKEYDGIVAKGGVSVVNVSDLPKDANIVGNRFILSIKDPGTESERYKAHWILLGHRDKYRHKIANDSPMLMRMMYRTILAIATTFFNNSIWTRDVEQAYMQSGKLQRDVFTTAPPEAKLGPDKYLKIELPHYGLVESSSCFFESYYPVFQNKLSMFSAPFDPCFLMQVTDGKLSGLTGIAMDDSINTGTLNYQSLEMNATMSFITKKNDKFPMRFLGCIINQNKNFLTLNQSEHIRKLVFASTTLMDKDTFRTVRGQLLFISQSTRPDISYIVAQLCQVKVESISRQDCVMLNETVKYLQESKELGIRFTPLEKSSMKLYVFVDSGHNTNQDKTSQLGMLVCLVDRHHNCQIIHWHSTKCQRVTRSMLAGEVYAFSMGYDYGMSLRMVFRQMKVDLPLYIFTDAKSIFDTITASKRLRELRLMTDIADIRRAYKHIEITNVAWVRSQQNIADNFTRRNGNNILIQTMRTGKLDFTIEQWIYKDDR